MKIIIDLCVVPIGVGVSLAKYIVACERVIAKAGLKSHLHANGTDIEGEWDDVFAAVKRCHEVVLDFGAPRIVTSLRINTRVDMELSMVVKINCVEDHLALS
jgi:uncharacterized protein (TIGR00106 family)